MTVRMTLHPQSLDTIVATNLHADILSDLAGALAGSLGVAPTANIDPERRYPSMFEANPRRAVKPVCALPPIPTCTFALRDRPPSTAWHQKKEQIQRGKKSFCADSTRNYEIGRASCRERV